MEYVLNLIGADCRDCGRSMVENVCWQDIPASVRIVIKKDFCRAGARGLCGGCYEMRHKSDRDSLLDYPRKTVPLVIFAEEYNALRQSGSTSHQIREVLKMNGRAFEKALERAKKAGLL